LATLAAVTLLVGGAGCRSSGEEAAKAADEGGVAVVELFTSEGCSSCPPADRVLGDLVADAGRRGQAVYCLAFHVDYWDRLGWADPYGSKTYSERQHAYARALGLDQVYTPQMIVNGSEEFVGSDAARAKKSIRAALGRRAAAGVKLETEAAKPGQLTVRYAVTEAPEGANLRVAFVEKEAATDVPRGENAGRKLRHFHVVRAFRSVDLSDSPKGEVVLDVPATKAGTVIAYLQEGKTLKIVGAASRDVPAAARKP
jgi:hypothetical protein